jgi:hypothetical protein
MKKLPCLIALAAIASPVLFTIASVAGVSLPFPLDASSLVGFSCASGALAFTLADYAPCASRRATPALRGEETKLVRKPAAPAAGWPERSVDDREAGGALAAFGLRPDPATVSLM